MVLAGALLSVRARYGVAEAICKENNPLGVEVPKPSEPPSSNLTSVVDALFTNSTVVLEVIPRPQTVKAALAVVVPIATPLFTVVDAEFPEAVPKTVI